MKINSLSKIVILIVGISLTFTNCEKNSLDHQESESMDISTNKYQLTDIDYDKIEENANLLNKLKTIGNSITLSGKSTKINISSSEGEMFTINMQNVKYLENIDGTYHSYTFLVEGDFENEFLNNLVVSLQPDGSYKFILASYNLTPEERIELINGNLDIDLKDKVSYKILDNEIDLNQILDSKEMEIACVNILISYCTWNNHPGGVEADGSPCPKQAFANKQSCSQVVGGTGGTDYGGESTGETGGGGSNTTTDKDYNDEVTVINVKEFSYSKYIIDYYNISDQETKATLEISETFSRSLYDYLKRKRYSQESEIFGEKALQEWLSGAKIDFEEEIIYDKSLGKYPCQRKIISNAVGTCSPLTEGVLNVFGANDKVNLIFKTTSSISANGNTTSTSIYNPLRHSCEITVTFRESYLQNATDLSIARTAIHESLHAYLVFMFEENLLYDESGTPISGFEKLTEAYIKYLGGLPSNLGTAHHEIMSNLVSDMATSLSSYAVENGYSNSHNFYKKLCWSGDLINTPTFQSLYPKYLNPTDEVNNSGNINPDYLDIINTNAAEQNNSTYSYAHPNGTTYSTSPIGKTPNSNIPCN